MENRLEHGENQKADPGLKAVTVVQVRADSDTGGVAWMDQTNHRL